VYAKRHEDFFAQAGLDGRKRRVTIGRCSEMSLAEARQRARVVLDSLRRGIDGREQVITKQVGTDHMDTPAHRIEVLTSEWPSNLKALDDAARELGIGAERLKGLADGGFATHYRIDGGAPLFRMSELKRWAAANLVQQIAGRELPAPIRVIAPAPRISDFRKVPVSLREIVGLCDITDEILRTGIYFLCREGALLYVGQSVNATTRVAEHYRRYEFDSVFFLPWPADDLNRIEGALIRALRPALNGKTPTGKMRAPSSSNDGDADLIALITNATKATAIEITAPEAIEAIRRDAEEPSPVVTRVTTMRDTTP
jgi:hypothetical protein